MRQELARIKGRRHPFTGEFVRFGRKFNMSTGRFETTVLLVDIRDGRGGPMCDHIWFNLTAQFRAVCLQRGDRVAFAAKVIRYVKGHDQKEETDYTLTRPSRVRRHTAA